MKTKQRPKRKTKKHEIISHFRPIQISGYLGDKLVASDRTAEHWKASQIAASWRDSGLTTSIVEK